MITKEELSEIAAFVKEYVCQAAESFTKDINEVILKTNYLSDIIKTQSEKIKNLETLPCPEKGDPGKDGEKGDPGKDGKDGCDGKDGHDGKNGEPGLPGEKGEPGKDGRDGKDGKDGRDGRDGKDGEDGRDALEIEILPDIDDEKNYQNGTYAAHNGGIWRKNGNWKCIVNGIADIKIENHQRTFSIKTVLSSGEVTEKTFDIPVMIYRGVYKAGESYAHGDVVTWSGSMFHCNDDTIEPPGTKSWTLCAKRGRDGRDSKQ